MDSISRHVWTGMDQHTDQSGHVERPQNDNASSPFLDKLSPEIRAIIYGHVFGSSEAITPTTWFSNVQALPNADNFRRVNWYITAHEDFSVLDRVIQTSILATNKHMYVEAINVLYRTRIVRGSVARLRDLFDSRNGGFLNHVRRVEISHCDRGHSPTNLLTTLQKLQDLPRICSIVVLSDCLSSSSHDMSVDFGWKVSDFAKYSKLGRIICFDVGVYRLEVKLDKVHIVNRQLVDMWLTVRNTPVGYDGFGDAMARINSLGASVFGHNVPAWASQTSLRCWVDIHQRLLHLRRSGEWVELVQKASAKTLVSGTDEMSIHHFHSMLQDATRLPISAFRLLGSGEYALRDLNPSDSSELLSEATEFLAANLVGYKRLSCHVTQAPETKFSPIRWGGNKDGKTTLEYMFNQQSVALSGGFSKKVRARPKLSGPEQPD